jgi:hypothetical protein
MKRYRWQPALCGVIFAFWFDAALAQKADYAAAAQAASPEASLDTYTAPVSPSLLETRKNEVLALIPQGDRPRFLAVVPKNRNEAYDYYGIVKTCIAKGWRNCM